MFATTILGATFSAIWLIMLAVVWIFVAFWPATMAKAKGYNFWVFLLLSLFFWWAMFFVVLFLPNRLTAQPAAAAGPTEE